MCKARRVKSMEGVSKERRNEREEVCRGGSQG